MKRFLSVLIVCSLGSGIALAMQDTATADEPKAESAEPTPPSPGIQAIRTRLEAAIERGEQQLERNRAALERLDNGETPTAVLRAMRIRQAPNAQRQRPNGQPPEGMRPDRQRPDQRRPDGPIELEEIKAFIGEHLPEMSDQIEKLATLDANSADRLTMRIAPKIEEIRHAFDEDEKFGELKLEELRAGLGFVSTIRLFRSAKTQEERASALSELRLAAEARFDVRIKLHEYELEKLSKKLLAMGKAMNDLRATRDQEIEQMVTAAQSGPRHRHSKRPKQDSPKDD